MADYFNPQSFVNGINPFLISQAELFATPFKDKRIAKIIPWFDKLINDEVLEYRAKSIIEQGRKTVGSITLKRYSDESSECDIYRARAFLAGNFLIGESDEGRPIRLNSLDFRLEAVDFESQRTVAFNSSASFSDGSSYQFSPDHVSSPVVLTVDQFMAKALRNLYAEAKANFDYSLIEGMTSQAPYITDQNFDI